MAAALVSLSLNFNSEFRSRRFGNRLKSPVSWKQKPRELSIEVEQKDQKRL